MRGGQHGSVLVVVLAISIIMTAAAAGYLAIGANAGGASADSRRLSRTYLAAESGLNLGVRWCKYYPYTNFNDNSTRAWADNLILSQSSIAGIAGWADFDGVQVKVVFKQGALNGGYHELDSYATEGAGMDTVKLTMQITGAAQVSSPPPGVPISQFNGYVNTWIDSLFPGR